MMTAEPERLSIRPGLWILASLLFLLLTALVLQVAAGVLSGSSSDALADWLVVRGAADGLSPGTPLPVLADRYNVVYTPPGVDQVPAAGRVHPRTPGALLLMAGLQWLRPDSVFDVYLLLNGVALVLLYTIVVPRLSPERSLILLALGLLVPATLATWRLVEFGSQAAVIALLVWLFVVGTARQDRAWAGIALGVGIALKLFPALLLVPAAMLGRVRTAMVALSTFVGLTALGIVVYGLDAGESVKGLFRAGRQWTAFSFNGSLAALLVLWGVDDLIASVAGVAAVTVGAILLARSGTPYLIATSGVIVLSVLGSPLAWDTYELVLFPAVMLILAHWGGVARTAAVGATAYGGAWVVLLLAHALLGSDAVPWSTIPMVALRLLLLAVLLSAAPAAHKWVAVRPNGLLTARS